MPSVQVFLGLAVVILPRPERANLRFCVFANIVYVQKEHKWAQHKIP